MPRNAAGIYSLPNPPVVSGTNIESADENDTRDDLAQEITYSLDRNGRGSMLAALKLFDGTSLAPGLTWGSDTDSGLVRNGDNDWSLIAGTTEVAKITANTMTIPATATLNVAGTTNLTGTVSMTGTVTFSGTTVVEALRGSTISPSQITANQNDYNPANLADATILRLSSDASRTITGLAGGADGRILAIHNIGAQNIVLADESGSSSAANRFALRLDYTIRPDNLAILVYDNTSQRWRVEGVQVASYVLTLLENLTADAFIDNLADAATAETAPAVGDLLLLDDISANAGRKMTLENMLKVVASLTQLSTGVATGDQLLIYDASATQAKRITVEDWYESSIEALTEDADPDPDIFYVAAEDPSGPLARKIPMYAFNGGGGLNEASSTASGGETVLPAGGASIPTWATRVEVAWANLSTNGTDNVGVILNGETSNYVGTRAELDATPNAANLSNMFIINSSGAAAGVSHGILRLHRVGSSDIWIAAGVGGASNAAQGMAVGGTKTSITNPLSTVAVQCSGSNTFDAGSIVSVRWW